MPGIEAVQQVIYLVFDGQDVTEPEVDGIADGEVESIGLGVLDPRLVKAAETVP